MKCLLGIAVAEATRTILVRHLLQFGFGREKLIQRKHITGVRILGFLKRCGVGNHSHDALLGRFRGAKQLDVIVVGLGHLLPVDTGNHRDLASNGGLWNRKYLAVLIVELDGNIAGDFNMLLLVFTHRHNR